ncbi:unnamed protein product [Sympodiomycopsis kandeliae]
MMSGVCARLPTRSILRTLSTSVSRTASTPSWHQASKNHHAAAIPSLGFNTTLGVARTMSMSSGLASSLASGSCVPCRKGSPQLLPAEAQEELHQLGQEWKIENVSGDEQGLIKVYKFKNFRTALAFTNQIGSIAEEQKHHPRLVTEWGNVEVAWWTHAIGGLHENDFIMAAKTEEIAQKAEGRK